MAFLLSLYADAGYDSDCLARRLCAAFLQFPNLYGQRQSLAVFNMVMDGMAHAALP